jgi:hypothetical protein
VKLLFLNSIVLKIIITVIICIGFILFIFRLSKNRAQREHLIGFSLLFEAIGYWWLFTWWGYVFIVIGFGLLIYSFVDSWNNPEEL